MKDNQLFIYIGMIVVCFGLWGLGSCTKYYIQLPQTENVSTCDTSELAKVRKELKEAKKTISRKQWRIDSLRIECHKKDGVIGDTNVFKIMRFSDDGKRIMDDGEHQFEQPIMINGRIDFIDNKAL